MKMKLLSGTIIFLFAFSAFSTGVILQSSAQEELDPDAVFSISLLSPNTNPARNAWSTLMQDTLPKIGIGVPYHDNTGWDVIAPRTFSYEATAESGIPLAADGGYDLFFVGLSGGIDYNPAGSHSTKFYSPAGNNFAFYDNAQVDTLIDQYTSELDPAARVPIAAEIQAFLQDELPYIGLVNTQSLWAYGSDWGITEDQFLMLSTTSAARGWKDLPLPGATDETLNYAHSYELTEFSPFVIQSYIAAQYISPTQGYLYERKVDDPNFAFEPFIASALPTVSADALTYTIPIRTDAKFSDGSALDVDDVVNSLRMHWTDVSIANSAGLQTYIAAATDINAVGGDLVVKLSTPYFLALNLLAGVPISPDELIGPWDNPTVDDFNKDAATAITYSVGAGPYKYSDIDDVAGNVQLVKVPGYFDGEAAIDTIEFEFFGSKDAAIAELEGGGIDVIDAQFVVDIAEVEGTTGIDYVVVADGGTQMMVINMRHPVMGTGVDTPAGIADPTDAALAAKYVRQAISFATPRDIIVSTILSGVGSKALTIWPELAAGYVGDQLEQYDYNLEKAKYWLTLAGYDVPNTYVPSDTDPTPLFVAAGEKSDEGGLPITNFVPLALIGLFVTAVISRRRK